MHLSHGPSISVGLAIIAATVPWLVASNETCQLPGPPSYPPTPKPEPISITELQLPPFIASTEAGACNADVNPQGTGCQLLVLSGDDSLPQAGTFTPDGRAIVVTVNFTGAPAAPDPASIYSGPQVILVKTDETLFPNGSPWKCISCGIPPENQLGRREGPMDYPRVFKDSKRILVGANIIETGGHSVTSDSVTPENTFIYPIHWTVTADGSGPSGSMRELRLHPDDIHLGWSSFAGNGQFAYYGRLSFNPSPTTGEPLTPRYDLTNINVLVPQDSRGVLQLNGDELAANFSALELGELRGFSGSGNEIIYIGYPWESCNFDGLAIHLSTGAIRRLTAHPEYVDPMDVSADDEWTVALDTRGSDRQMFIAGMRGIPPISDLVTTSVSSATRNNGYRRFFQPILIDKYGDRGDYFGQQINAAGDGSPDSINDPNWNARADPHFSLDGTRIMYYQTLVKTPACGGQNPLACPISTYPDGRTTRVMVANLTSRELYPVPDFPMGPDVIPWATPYVPGQPLPSKVTIPPGNYTYMGKYCGNASVTLFGDASDDRAYGRVLVHFNNLSDDGENYLNGFEDISLASLATWTVRNDWYSDIVQTGKVNGTKKTSPDGFHITMNVLENFFNATGTLDTMLDGKTYSQPQNFT